VSAAALEAFLSSTVAGGGRGALDSYDYDAWKQLDIVERGTALEAVLEKLRRRENDPRAFWFLLQFGISEVVQDIIPLADEYPTNETLVWLLKYLWEEDVEPKWLDRLGEIARTWPDPSLRQDAARVLGESTNPWKPQHIPDLLLPVALDEDEDVRFAVQQAFFKTYPEFAESEFVAPSAYSVIPRLLLSDLTSVQREGARLLSWAVRRAANGASVFLGSFTGNDEAMVERFADSWRDRSKPEIDAEAACALNGMGRWWAEQCLFGSIHDDVRAVRCLQAMRSADAVPFLRDLAENGFGPAADAAESALEDLAPLAVDPALTAVRAEARAELTVDRAAQLGETLAAADPERLFDAAIDLAVQPDPVRVAFRDGAVRGASNSWLTLNRSQLDLALDVRDDG